MRPTGEVLRRVDWSVVPLDHGTAVRMVQCWHYSRSAPNTSVARHGLVPASGDALTGDPFGVAMWMPPTKAAGVAVARDHWKGVLTLSRLAVAPAMPANAASFLLAGSMRLLDRSRWPVLVTYADTAMGHTGAIYRATNWRCDGPVKAGDVWVGPNGERRGRKRGPRNLSVAEMRAAGFERAPALPKIRFVHDPHGLTVEAVAA